MCHYFIDHTPPKWQGDWCGAIHKGACKVYSKDCEYNKGCYYKQLKRLEQENAELKAENERLQKLTCFNCGEETLNPSGAEIYDKILVYKQTLQEIKEIAEKTGCRAILDLITKVEEE